MKKYLLILLMGALSIAHSQSFGKNSLELLTNKRDSILVPVAHAAGKRLTKGTWLLGGTLSAKSNNYSDVDLLVVDVEDFDQRAFNLRLEGSYFYKENVSVGLGLQYGENKADLVANLLDNSYTRKIRNFSRNYGVLGFIKNHIPISSNNVFYATNQTELFYGYKSGPSETYIGDILERNYAVKHSVGVSIRPGILVFLTDDFAFDLNMGILGFSHFKEDVSYQYPENNPPSESNRKKDSTNKSTDLNLKFDLLKIGFGFSYYF
ncbi:MAG TPA: hypothetical protein VFC69_07440 [Dysgonamonadaceae bacterium]|nr:hypothetical protein [Dysgonamonadaceae bacterium]